MRAKDPLFTLEERTEMVMAEARKLANGVEIEARPFDNLLIHFAEQCGAGMIIRGLGPSRISSTNSRWLR